jgi:hypothetical protein
MFSSYCEHISIPCCLKDAFAVFCINIIIIEGRFLCLQYCHHHDDNIIDVILIERRRLLIEHVLCTSIVTIAFVRRRTFQRMVSTITRRHPRYRIAEEVGPHLHFNP